MLYVRWFIPNIKKYKYISQNIKQNIESHKCMAQYLKITELLASYKFWLTVSGVAVWHFY